MFANVNQRIGGWLGRLGGPLGAIWQVLIGILRPSLQFTLGEWRAPAWLRLFGRGLAASLNWCRWHGAQMLLVLAIGLDLDAAAFRRGKHHHTHDTFSVNSSIAFAHPDFTWKTTRQFG